jgi:Na+/melibiose symporter-like transporter
MDQPPETNKLRFWHRYRGLPRNVFALSLVSLLNDTSSEIIYPLLPVFLFLTLGASPFFIGLIEGFSESIASILKLFSGYLSDRFHKRKLPVFLGYSLAAVVRPLLAFVSSWQQVLAVRMTDRIGKGIRGAPRDALLAASVPREKRGLAFGFNRAADHLGAVIGPIIAFLLLSYIAADPESPTARDYQQVFLFASVPVVIGLFVIIFFVHEETKPVKEFDSIPIKFSIREFDGNFKRFLVVMALFTLSNSTDAAAFVDGFAFQQGYMLDNRWRPFGQVRTKTTNNCRMDRLRACLCGIRVCRFAVAGVGFIYCVRSLFWADRRD